MKMDDNQTLTRRQASALCGPRLDVRVRRQLGYALLSSTLATLGTSISGRGIATTPTFA
jgi:hypothetical protein